MTREEAIQHLLKFAEDNKYKSDEMGFLSGLIRVALRNPWHKVSEELPKETCEVLICWETVKHERKWTRKVMFRRDVDNHKIWYFDDVEDGVVTPDYWMPIPELPKED